ncbi:hypothetical protein V8F06_004173 [Rhypophila decipiens]
MDLNHGNGSVATVGCQYVIPSLLQSPTRQKDLANLFQRAVCSTVLGHPLCQGSPHNQGNGSPSWHLVPGLDLDQLITWQFVQRTEDYNDVRQQILVRQLNTAFTSVDERVEWRIIVIRQHLSDVFEAFFTFSSTKFDEKCAKIFHEDVLHNLNCHSRRCSLKGPITGWNHVPTGRGLQATTPTPISTPREFLLSKGASLWKKYAPNSLRLASSANVWSSVDTGQPCETGLKTVFIPCHVVEAVLDECRHRKEETGNKTVTITALLQTMTMFSLARQIPVTEFPALKSVTTIDLRRYMSQQDTANLVGHQNQPRGPAKTIMNVVGQVTHNIFPSDSVARTKARSDSWYSRACSLEEHRISSVTIWPTIETFTAKPPRQSGGEPPGPELKSSIWEVTANVRANIETKLAENDLETSLDRSSSPWKKQTKETSKRPQGVAAFQVNNLVTMDGLDPTVLDELERQVLQGARAVNGQIGLPPAPQQAPWMKKNLKMDGPYPSLGWNSRNPSPAPTINKRHGIVFKDWDAELPKPWDENFSMVKLAETAKMEEKQEEGDKITNTRFYIKRANLAVSPRGTGSPIHLSVFTVNGGDMVIDLTYQRGAVEDDVIETLAEDLQGWLPWISKGKGNEPMKKESMEKESMEEVQMKKESISEVPMKKNLDTQTWPRRRLGHQEPAVRRKLSLNFEPCAQEFSGEIINRDFEGLVDNWM